LSSREWARERLGLRNAIEVGIGNGFDLDGLALSADGRDRAEKETGDRGRGNERR
jgi:hypothetical protein